MPTYRGKRFRPESDDTSGFSEGTSSRQQIPQTQSAEQSRAPRQHHPSSRGPERRTTRTSARVSGRRAEREATQRAEREAHAQQADPYAFKHHDALLESGGKRHSKRKTLLIVIPIIIVVVAALIAGGLALSNFFSEEQSTVEAGVPVTVTIPEGASANEIANILKEKDVISNTQTFLSELRTMGVEQSLKPGTYELETLMDTKELINLLITGPVADAGTNLTIPEGLTAQQTAEIVENAVGIAQEEFLTRVYAANEYVADYPFLEGVYNNSLEGFLYPKTYSVPEDADADYVIRMLLNQFALETSELDLSAAEAGNLSLFNVVTIASLIEKETAAEDERVLVSSVIYNRLSIGMKLQIDATVIYALGDSYTGEDLTYADLEVESPYNTYATYELPAGPICSPSINSIEAAAHPADTEYLYYVLTSVEGFHTFCVTEDEFYAAKEEYNALFGIE